MKQILLALLGLLILETTIDGQGYIIIKENTDGEVRMSNDRSIEVKLFENEVFYSPQPGDIKFGSYELFINGTDKYEPISVADLKQGLIHSRYLQLIDDSYRLDLHFAEFDDMRANILTPAGIVGRLYKDRELELKKRVELVRISSPTGEFETMVYENGNYLAPNALPSSTRKASTSRQDKNAGESVRMAELEAENRSLREALESAGKEVGTESALEGWLKQNVLYVIFFLLGLIPLSFAVGRSRAKKHGPKQAEQQPKEEEIPQDRNSKEDEQGVGNDSMSEDDESKLESPPPVLATRNQAEIAEAIQELKEQVSLIEKNTQGAIEAVEDKLGSFESFLLSYAPRSFSELSSLNKALRQHQVDHNELQVLRLRLRMLEEKEQPQYLSSWQEEFHAVEKLLQRLDLQFDELKYDVSDQIAKLANRHNPLKVKAFEALQTFMVRQEKYAYSETLWRNFLVTLTQHEGMIKNPQLLGQLNNYTTEHDKRKYLIDRMLGEFLEKYIQNILLLLEELKNVNQLLEVNLEPIPFDLGKFDQDQQEVIEDAHTFLKLRVTYLPLGKSLNDQPWPKNVRGVKEEVSTRYRAYKDRLLAEKKKKLVVEIMQYGFEYEDRFRPNVQTLYKAI